MTEISNTAPLIKDGKKLSRKFLGNLFPKTTIEKKELDAYLKGGSNFTFGIDFETKMPRSYKVRQEYFYIKN